MHARPPILCRLIFALFVLATCGGFASDCGLANTVSLPLKNLLVPVASLSFSERMQFRLGEAFFSRLWVMAPATTKAADGLGPLYNGRSCNSCHQRGRRGSTPMGSSDLSPSLILRLGSHDVTGQVRPDKFYGYQLQELANPGHRSEGRKQITYQPVLVDFPDGFQAALRRPHYAITDQSQQISSPDILISPRLSPAIIGLGYIEAIAEEDIAMGEDPEDKNGDGISGRVHWITSLKTNTLSLGRFGWKAGQFTIEEQVQTAFYLDMGLSVPLLPMAFGDCTIYQSACRMAPSGASGSQVEVSQEMVDLVTFYIRHIALPERRNSSDPGVQKGERVFYEIGCTSCHRPSYITSLDSGSKLLAGKKIWPWTDLLLHDMGPDLADDFAEHDATNSEWRTPALWGIGLARVVGGSGELLHDGRAKNIEEAILWHGGEAEKSRANYMALSTVTRQHLISFIRSL